MHTRRDFLGLTLKGATTAAATGLLAKAAFAANSDGTAREQTSDAGRSGHYRPPFAFGMGGVPLGNEFEYVTDEDAYATMAAAWNAGVRYFEHGALVRTGSGRTPVWHFSAQPGAKPIRSFHESRQIA